MKVVFVVGGLPFGGIENLLFDVSKELIKRNFRFKIINISGTGSKLQEFLNAGISIINLNKNLKTLKTYRLDTAFKLRKLLKEISPNIVHSMQFSADYFSRISSLSINTKIITHIHNIKREHRIERRIFNKFLSLRTNIFLSVSKEVYRIVEKEHNLFSKPHYILYNGVDFSKFKVKTRFRLGSSFKYIVCVGRLVKQKNFDIAIKAFSLIEKELPNTKLLIVGEGNEKEKLKDLAKSLNLSNKVIFTGYRSDVPGILKQSHVLLMPSEYEGLGIAHLEAMYAGLPAVISPNVPSKEIASNCSFVVPINPKDIANAVKKLLSDENLYKELSEKAKETAKNYSIENYVNKLIDLYNGALTGKLPDRKVL
ncbi:Glycosyltransferase involved in cell wall bisynthesis [Balnearium lithotrophicum]|uniref:Glycosyltransferase involved in cell wall bisynthesis n=1 Tax=Balnearium lithotrophicum TaxID=223788 RepID=A0A521BT96_9BACT|nr:glycosyltransferase [Balnearium lithotrophicum]SMO50363.1 Glycosyltransferase involved in cell wall bisynthesis [Balnearium lithotrophicum]